jgi:DNA-binding CsgD family transcriptional regulator/WD40 repeat protein
MPDSEPRDFGGASSQRGDRLPAAAGRTARDRDRLRASEAAIAREVIEFQEARQRVGLRSLEAVSPLSVREREVLALVAAGRSDGDIATDLFISKKTASVHVANIKAKLGASSRVEIALLAVRLGLVESTQELAPEIRREDHARRARVVCPFKGLACYDVADARYFFGRERLVAELVAKLAGASFVGVVGASGSGKSSVVRAGLVPALGEGVLPGSDQWITAIARPGPSPMVALERAVDAAARHAQLAIPEGADVAGWLESVPPGRRLAVVVDQFEETFTVCHDEAERAGFVAALVALASDPGRRAVLVVSIRADFYGRCAEFRELSALLSTSQVLVGPMTADELARAVELPARTAGLRVEPDLTSAIVSDVVGEPGGLPLLSTALLDLWQRRDGRTLRHLTYVQVGGVTGAVARLAEAAYGRLTASQQAAARAAFLRLAAGGIDGSPVVRRPVPIAEFDSIGDLGVAAVLAALTESRLLTVSDDAVEISHEALLREWPRLRDWLEEDAEGRRHREHLTVAARNWDAGGRDPGELYRGARLSAALEWAGAHDEQLNRLERDFIAESRGASEHELREQRRTNRRLRILLVGVGVFLVLALVAGLLAAAQASRAEREAQVARARELAASAVTVLDEDPGLSKLLALAAASIDDPPIETITALHAALANDPVVYRYTWPADRTQVTNIVTDLSPSGRHLVAAGFWFQKPHDYLEVVDIPSDDRLWSVETDDSGVGLGYGFFSPDGTRVVFGGYREAAPPRGGDPSGDLLGVHVRDTVTGALLQRWDVGPCGAVVVAVSARNALIRTSTGASCIVLTYDPSQPPVGMEVIDLATGDRTPLTPDAALSDMGALSRDGRWAAFADVSGDRPSPFLIDLRTGDRSQIGVDHRGVWDVSDDGRFVAIGDAPVQIWDVRTGTTTPLGATMDTGGVSYAEFGPGGHTIFTTRDDSLVRRWDATTGSETGSWPGATAGRPALSTDGLLLVGHWGTPTAALIDTNVRGELGAAETRALTEQSPENERCDTGRITGAGRLQVSGGKAIFTEYCYGGFRRPEGDIAIGWSTYVYDLATLDVRAFNGVSQAALSSDGRRLAVQEARVDGDRLVTGPMRIIDLASDAVVELEGLCAFDWQRTPSDLEALADEGPCRAFPNTPFPLAAQRIQWSPDGTMLAVVGEAPPGYFAVWQTDTGRLVRDALAVIPHGTDEPTRKDIRTTDLAFTTDSQDLIAVVLDDDPVGELLRISTTTWEVEHRRELTEPELRLRIVGDTPDGKGFLGISQFHRLPDEALHWIDAETLAPIRPPRERLHEGALYAAELSPNRALLATGSSDGLLRIWDVATGAIVHEMEFSGQSVDGVAFVDNVSIAVLLGDQGNLTLLTIDEPTLLTIARKSLTRGFSAAECERFDFETCPSLEEMTKGSGERLSGTPEPSF